MAISSCPKCTGHSFEIVEQTPNKANFIHLFIQCAACGTVVGTTTFFDAGQLSSQNQQILEKLEARIANVEALLSRLTRSQ